MKRTKKRKLTAATGCSESLARSDAVNKDTPRIKRQWETDLVETRKEFISIGQAEESTSATDLSVFSGQPESSQKDESVEVQLVQAMKRKEAKWEAWPRSFLVSEEAKRRYGKVPAQVFDFSLDRSSLHNSYSVGSPTLYCVCTICLLFLVSAARPLPFLGTLWRVIILT